MDKVQELEQQLQEMILKNKELESQYTSLQSKLSKLSDELLYLRRVLFGRSSERYIKEDPNQLRLDFQGQVQIEEEKLYLQTLSKKNGFDRIATTQSAKKHPVRKPLPDHLERRQEIIEPSPLPPAGSKCIGQEITEVLEYIPGQLYVRQIIRKKYALKEGEGVIIGELPSLTLPKSNAGASLLAQLLVSKYQDHLPFYRQLEMFKRSGIQLAASTVNDWCSSAIQLLEPLYEHLRKQVLACDYIQIDESTIPVVDKDKPGATRKGYHWLVRSPQENKLFFHYDKGSRGKHVVVELLKDFKGAVQSDGYGVYEMYEKKEGVLLLGCWAHARRKFEQALANDPPRAEYAIKQIQRLYQLERQATENDLTIEQVQTIRKEESYPILRDFEKWIDLNYPQVLPSSKIGTAMSYTYGIYQRLVRYVVDGRYRIDNNLAENAIRPLALGRKNYMFCLNHQAAERTAMIYSLLGTCKICGVNPVVWLTDVLNRISDHSILKLDELLPDKWAQLRQEELSVMTL